MWSHLFSSSELLNTCSNNASKYYHLCMVEHHFIMHMSHQLIVLEIGGTYAPFKGEHYRNVLMLS